MESFVEKNEVFKKLEMMDRTNLDKIDGFVKCLIFQREELKTLPGKRQPLLIRKKQDE